MNEGVRSGFPDQQFHTNARKINVELASNSVSHLRDGIEKLDEYFGKYRFALYKEPVIHACYTLREYFSNELNNR